MENLKRKLEIVKDLGFIDNRRIIRKLCIEDKLNVVSIEYVDKFENEYYSKDLKEVDTWMANDDNIDVHLDSKGKIEVILWEGGSYDGRRKRKRWRAELTGGLEVLENFRDYIEQAFNRTAKQFYEEEQELKRLNRIEAIKRELLAK